MVNFTLSEEQEALRNLAREFAEKEIAPVAAYHDRTGEFPWQIVKRAREIGLRHITIEERFGGGGLGWFETALVDEEMGAACAGIKSIFGAHELALTPLSLAGSEEQKREFLLPITRGSDGEGRPLMAAYCLTEPDAGSDVGAIRTRAERVGDEYIITGTKHFISNGSVASLYTVFASTNPEQKHRGLSVFMVPRDSPGIRAQRMGEKLGQRASDTAEVVFQEVRVPAANRLGREGDGFKLAMAAFDCTRIGVGAAGVGVARAALQASLKFAKAREQFGQPIANFQAIQFMLADMAIKIETARLMNWYAAWLVDQNRPSTYASAIAKCYGSDIAMEAALNAVQIHGGYGYMQEFGVEKLMRDAKLLQIYEGTNQVQRLVIARQLLKE